MGVFYGKKTDQSNLLINLIKNHPTKITKNEITKHFINQKSCILLIQISSVTKTYS